MPGVIFQWLLILFVGLATTTAGRASVGDNDPRYVVMLNSTDPYLPAFIAVDSALQEAIRANTAVPVELLAETLDMQRFPRGNLEPLLVDLMKAKYRNLKVDVVVAYATIALEFAEQYGAEIWPGATIVFNSVSTDILHGKTLASTTAGVSVRLEFESTLALALQLVPNAEQITIVAGAAETDSRLLSLAQAALQSIGDPVPVQFLLGLPPDELVKQVELLPSRSVVLYLTVFRDNAGIPHIPREVLTQIAHASPAPVFGVFETYLGDGIAAGAITSYAAQGYRTGEMVAGILNGDTPASFGIETLSRGVCMADARQLEHWGIPTKLLPADCDIRFQATSVFQRYRWQILTATSVILAQFALILMLMLNRRRLSRAQTELHEENVRRLEVERETNLLLGRLARFSRERSLGAMVTTISHEISQPLIAIQNYAQAARRRLQSEAEYAPKQLELIAKIETQAQRAGTITQRVRNLVTSNEPELVPLALSPLITEVILMLEPDCQAANCRIEFQPTGPVPKVLGDALQLQLVLINLVTNAIKSVAGQPDTDRTIVIQASATEEQLVRISVVDWGTGIQPEKVHYIFDPLYSGSGASMGIGLAICRDIIQAHHGQIWYEANAAGGAIFHITLRSANP